MSLAARSRAVYAACVQLCARVGMPGLAARLVAPALTEVKTVSGEARQTILILPKDGFMQDIMAALELAPEVAVVAMPRTFLRRMSRAFLPYFIDDNNYASAGPEFDGAKTRYRRFLRGFLTALSHKRRFDAIVTGNFGYCAEREFAAAASELGIPFLALHKENLKTPGRVAFFERIYRERRGPFAGKRILVYNAVERDLQIRAGVAPAERIDIVGMPRLDRMHAWRRANAGATVPRRILFFMFSPATGMPRIARKTRKAGQVYFEDRADDAVDISLAELCRQTCRALVRIAREHPHIEVTVKTKGRWRDIGDAVEQLTPEDGDDLPGNLRIAHGGDVLKLVAEASVVCGFNSTALLECIAAGKPVVLPWFAEAEHPEVLPYVIDLRDICATARSPDELYRRLVEAAEHPAPVPAEPGVAERACLEHWTGNPDGQAGQRTRDALLGAARAT